MSVTTATFESIYPALTLLFFVLQQAMLYVTVFYLTYMWSFINRLLQQTLGHTFYGLVVCQAIFDPLQGFLNFFVYQRPCYLKERREHPHLSRWQCLTNILRLTCYGEAANRMRSSSLSSRGTSNQQSAELAAAPPRTYSSTLNRSSRQSISDLAIVAEGDNESADQEPSEKLIQVYDSDSDDDPDPADSEQFMKKKMQEGAVVDVNEAEEDESPTDEKEVTSQTKEITDNEEPPVEDCDSPPVAVENIEEATAPPAAGVVTAAAIPAISQSRSVDTEETNEIEFVPESQEFVPESHSDEAAVSEPQKEIVEGPDTTISVEAAASKSDAAVQEAPMESASTEEMTVSKEERTEESKDAPVKAEEELNAAVEDDSP